MPTGLALATLLHACAPRVGPRTLTAIITVESGGNPYAMHDNTSGSSYFPISAARATDLANALIAAGHSIDLGLAQINSMNLPGLGLSAADMFDPCTNVRTSARILTGAYHRAAARYGSGQVALRHALGAYNTGSIYAGNAYISRVLAAAGAQPRYFAPPQRIAVLPPRRPQPTIIPTTAYKPEPDEQAVEPDTADATKLSDFSVEATADR